MKIFNTPKITKKFKSSALAIVNFDGVHRGHQKVFLNTKNFARKNKIKFGILTFHPLPVMFFNKNIKNYRLISEETKFYLLKKYGVDFIINIKFNKNFSKILAENFIYSIIYKKINPKLKSFKRKDLLKILKFQIAKDSSLNLKIFNKIKKKYE